MADEANEPDPDATSPDEPDADEAESFADALLAARRDARLTQQELADEIGAGHATIVGWEKGPTLPRTEKVVTKIERALHVKGGHLVKAYRRAKQSGRQLLDPTPAVPPKDEALQISPASPGTQEHDPVGVPARPAGRTLNTGASPSKRAVIIATGLAVLVLVGFLVALRLWWPRDGDKDTLQPPGPGGSSTGAAPPPAPVPTVLTPIADTYVNQGAPNRNFSPKQPDFSSELFSRGKPGLVTYLRFTFPSAPPGKKLTKAVLLIRTTPGSNAGSADTHDVRVAPDTWTESEITWANQPQLTPLTAGVINAPQVDTPYSIPLDVTTLQGFVGARSLAVTSTNPEGTDGLIFWGSRFEREDYRVRLLLTFE